MKVLKNGITALVLLSTVACTSHQQFSSKAGKKETTSLIPEDHNMSKSEVIKKHIRLEQHGSVAIAYLDGGPHQLIGLDMAEELSNLLDSLEKENQAINAVIFTSKHPDYFLAHADVRWLQEGGASIPKLGLKSSSMVATSSNVARNTFALKQLASLTPLDGGMQLDKLHDTFLRMNRSGVLFVAALNGSAMGLGSEFAQACDMRIMADGDYVIGQPEILLGINPGGGGTQRLPRLIGNHRALLMMLEGKPVSPKQALEIGYVDQVVSKDQLLSIALEKANYLSKRPKSARAAIKRAVYFGGSDSLEKGLHIERTEFIHISPTDTAQRLMKSYLDQTEQRNSLPFYDQTLFQSTLGIGELPSQSTGE